MCHTVSRSEKKDEIKDPREANASSPEKCFLSLVSPRLSVAYIYKDDTLDSGQVFGANELKQIQSLGVHSSQWEPH